MSLSLSLTHTHTQKKKKLFHKLALYLGIPIILTFCILLKNKALLILHTQSIDTVVHQLVQICVCRMVVQNRLNLSLLISIWKHRSQSFQQVTRHVWVSRRRHIEL